MCVAAFSVEISVGNIKRRNWKRSTLLAALRADLFAPYITAVGRGDRGQLALRTRAISLKHIDDVRKNRFFPCFFFFLLLFISLPPLSLLQFSFYVYTWSLFCGVDSTAVSTTSQFLYATRIFLFFIFRSACPHALHTHTHVYILIIIYSWYILLKMLYNPIHSIQNWVEASAEPERTLKMGGKWRG